jgi:hypothetical protein
VDELILLLPLTVVEAEAAVVPTLRRVLVVEVLSRIWTIRG